MIGEIRWKKLGLALSFALLLCGRSWALENCLYELSGAEPNFLVLGSEVVPQASYLLVADCNLTADEARDALIASAHDRAAAEEAEASARLAKKQASDELWARMREGQAQEAAGQSAGLGGWWTRMWE